MQSIKKKLNKLQANSIEVILNLSNANKHAADIICAMDIYDMQGTQRAIHEFAVSIQGIADSLEQYLDTAYSLTEADNG